MIPFPSGPTEIRRRATAGGLTGAAALAPNLEPKGEGSRDKALNMMESTPLDGAHPPEGERISTTPPITGVIHGKTELGKRAQALALQVEEEGFALVVLGPGDE